MIEDIEDKLRTYFASEGYIEHPIDQFPQEVRPDMAFKRNSDLLFVYIIDLHLLSSKSVILRKIMRMAAVKKHCNLTYVAAPKIVATTLDSAALEEHGIGMLIVNDDVREVVPAKYMEVESKPAISEEVKRKISELEEKISRLERAIANMEIAISRIEYAQPQPTTAINDEKLSEIERELSKIRDDILLLSRRISNIEERMSRAGEAKKIVITKPPEITVEVKKAAEGLPSFFKDNPWLSILSSRGKSIEES